LHGTWTPYVSSPSLHDALPISLAGRRGHVDATTELGAVGHRDLRSDEIAFDLARREQLDALGGRDVALDRAFDRDHARLNRRVRSEEHTSELQSRENLVCRLLL